MFSQLDKQIINVFESYGVPYISDFVPHLI